MRNGRRRILNTGLALTLILGGCFLDEEENNSDGGGLRRDGGVQQDKGNTPPPSGVFTTTSANKTVEVDIKSSTSEYLVVPYSVSSSAADAIDFDITVTGGKTGTTTHKLRWRPAPLRQRNYALWQRWQDRLDVERWSRAQAEYAATTRLVPLPGEMNQHMASCTTSADCTSATEVCHNQACASSVSVKVSGFSNKSTITAQVKKKGTIAAVLVDSTDTVSDATVKAVLDKFEQVIYPRDVALFGNPKLTSSGSTLSSDRNGDGLVWLVISKEVSSKKKAVGFFYAVDFSQTATDSNQADILYVDAASTAKAATVYTILAHEFQHLLNFAVKKYRPEKNGGTGALEALWLDEGLSHLAEDACGFGGENVTMLDQELFTAMEDASAFFKDDNSGNRAMAMLYLRYLFEQKGGVSYASGGGITDRGGAAFLQALRGAKQGTAIIDQAYGDHKAAFDKFIAALALDGRGVTTYAPYLYMPLASDPLTGAKIGVKIRGSRQDATGATIKLTGPLEEDLTGSVNDTIANAGARFYKLTGKTGKVTIKVAATASDFRYAVVKVK